MTATQSISNDVCQFYHPACGVVISAASSPLQEHEFEAEAGAHRGQDAVAAGRAAMAFERDQIVDRIVRSETPRHVEYTISRHGETLIAVLQQMADWGEIHRARIGQSIPEVSRTQT